MKIWTFTLAYTTPEVLEASLARHAATHTTTNHTHVLLDHHWPKDYWQTRHRILELAEKYNLHVMSPYKNMGGHGGYNWMLEELPIADEDLIITFDSDSNPTTVGWDTALIEALRDNPDYAYLSLMPDFLLDKRWEIVQRGDMRLAHPPRVDMFNISAWRASFLRAIDGWHANSNYYGHLEVAMSERRHKLGLKHAYLYDYQETHGQVQQLTAYRDWKAAHAHGSFKGNFDEYLANGAV